ncbi:MAG TPA: DegT/DnrJ/EryC1/StrS aminotransferase family protein [Dehalococcoidia bacterium]|nr:DegT/DnrJ/EryC1/StrS aminotransferase family protein [Dehalococcoidia bacterium]
MEFIPVALPALAGNEKRYVNECLDSTWISSSGEFIDRFEGRFAEFCGTEHALTCSNGTVALHLALLALGIGPGDEVLVPSLTYVATANAVRYCGADPVFVDSDRATWSLDPTDLRRKVTDRTRAIVAVHLYGRPAPMSEIMALARERGLRVVEDAAEAHGALSGGQPVGSIGDLGTFSFYGNKIITCGEGGMVVTRDAGLAERVRLLRGQGQDPTRRYWFTEVGYNYRMTNLQAAIGLAQLENVESFLAARDEIARWYDEELGGLPGVQTALRTPGDRTVCWLYSVILSGPAGTARDDLLTKLRQAGIDTRPFFHPLHVLPPYRDRCRSAEYPNAEWLGARGFNLPAWVGMSREHVRRVAATLREVLPAAVAAR